MTSLRDFFGTPCPVCAKDILQPAPQTARMPRHEAWCPSCKSELTLDTLVGHRRAAAGAGGFWRRIFGKPDGRIS